jgi:hypothetical protein
MTETEFYDWLRYHKAKFPGLIRWSDNLPDEATESDPSRDDVMTSWFRTLSHCSLDDAKAATDLLGTDAEPEPKGWDRHPLAIASICRGLRHESRTSRYDRPQRRVVDGHDVYECPTCRDRGEIVVWHPLTMRAAFQGKIAEAASRGELYCVSVACAACRTWTPARRSEGGVTFDPQKMLPVPSEGRLADHVDELVAFVSQRYEAMHTWDADNSLNHLGGF